MSDAMVHLAAGTAAAADPSSMSLEAVEREFARLCARHCGRCRPHPRIHGQARAAGAEVGCGNRWRKGVTGRSNSASVSRHLAPAG
jgi:hypothetical protein